MQVTVLRQTEQPEKLVCEAARGDYYDGFVPDVSFAELMDSVDYNESDIESVIKESDNVDEGLLDQESYPRYLHIEAQKKNFIEKQLSRGHYGPWEHPQITFAVKGVSRVTMAQITRHRHMTFDVQSQRYVDFSEKEAITPKSIKSANHFSREDGVVDIDEEEQEIAKTSYENLVDLSFEWYEEMVEKGVPKEDARFGLPVGTPVNMTFSGNARTFMHLLDMRKKANAQWEIRELSEEIIEHLKAWMPYTYRHYERNAPHKLSP